MHHHLSPYSPKRQGFPTKYQATSPIQENQGPRVQRLDIFNGKQKTGLDGFFLES